MSQTLPNHCPDWEPLAHHLVSVTSNQLKWKIQEGMNACLFTVGSKHPEQQWVWSMWMDEYLLKQKHTQQTYISDSPIRKWSIFNFTSLFMAFPKKKMMAMIEIEKFRKEHFSLYLTQTFFWKAIQHWSVCWKNTLYIYIIKSDMTLFRISFSLSPSRNPSLSVLTLERNCLQGIMVDAISRTKGSATEAKPTFTGKEKRNKLIPKWTCLS